MAKQPVKKKDVSKLNLTTDRIAALDKFKEDNDLNNVKEKDLEWIRLPEAFYEAVKLPGIPKGYFSMIRGLSDTGKSTVKLQLIAELQRVGILPIIYETEGNFPWEHARMCGVEFTEVWGEVENEETGEIERKVIDHKGFFIYHDQDILFRKYGKMDYAAGKELTKPNRKIAVLEDIAYSINDYLDKQGDASLGLDCEMCFIWDSVGSIGSYKSLMSKSGNNMFDAAAIKQSFATIVNNKIPMSRKETSEYTNTFFVVNKVWIDSMQMGQPQMKNSGGEGFKYAVRLAIEVGGTVTSGVSKLKATSGGKDYNYGILTKIKVTKNQVTGIEYEGKICSVPHGLWSPDKLDQYKKEYSKFLLSKLSEISGRELNDSDDITLSIEESYDEV